jgi:hypothetical protein
VYFFFFSFFFFFFLHALNQPRCPAARVAAERAPSRRARRAAPGRTAQPRKPAHIVCGPDVGPLRVRVPFSLFFFEYCIISRKGKKKKKKKKKKNTLSLSLTLHFIYTWPPQRAAQRARRVPREFRAVNASSAAQACRGKHWKLGTGASCRCLVPIFVHVYCLMFVVLVQF